MSYLIAIYFLVFVILAWRRLDWAIMLIIFSLWSYLIRFSVLGIPATLLEGMIVLAFIIWLIKNGRQVWQRVQNRWRIKERAKRYPFDWEMIALLLISLGAVITAGWTNSALGVWKAYFLEPIIFFLLVFNVLGQDKKYFKIFCPLAASAIVLSVVALYQKLTGYFTVPEFWTETTQRATSLFPYPNAVGLFLAPVTMMLVGWLAHQLTTSSTQTKDRIIRIIGLCLAIGLSIGAIISAQSDGALIAVIIALIAFGLLANRKLASITFLIILFSVLAIAVQPTTRQKILDKVTLFDVSGQIRQQQWKETAKMLKDGYWFWGTGLANYQAIIKPYHQEGIFVKNHDPQWLDKVLYDEEYHKAAWQPVEIYLYPHNILLNFWTELGLLGAILFIWLIIRFIVISLRNIFSWEYGNRYLTLGLLGAMITIVVHGLVDVPYFKNDLAILFWLLFATLGIINIHNQEGQKQRRDG